MSKNGIRVEEFNIFALGGEAVSYHLKDIHTIALQVTRERIGGLSLELEVELTYGLEEEPRLSFWAARGTKEEPENDRNLVVQPGDWLVILWDEIHKFKDEDFRSTFSFDGLSAPRMTGQELEQAKEYLNRDAAAAVHIGDPVTPRGGTDAKFPRFRPYIPNPGLANKVDFERVAQSLNDPHEDAAKDAQELEALRRKLQESHEERTEIVPVVGELDTDESNSPVDPADGGVTSEQRDKMFD